MFTKKYNKALILLLVLCFFISGVFSQTVYSNKESSTFSFTVGLTSSNLIKDSVRYSPGILFNGGFMYTVVLSNKFNIGIDLLYTGKGFKNDSPIIKYRYYYVDIPLYLQYKLSDNVRINLGGQYSTFTNSQMVVIDQTKNSGVDAKKGNSIKDTDYGILAGLEVNLNEDISLAARYTISGSTFFEKNKINFGVFQLSFNYVAFKTHKQFFHRNE